MTYCKSLMILAPALALVGCSDEPAERIDDGDQQAKGEILGGTISDAMLPIESVTSQSPPLERQDNRALSSSPVEATEESVSDPDPTPAESDEAEPSEAD